MEQGRTIMEVVLSGAGLLQEAGEEHLLQVQMLVLVQGLLQALGAPRAAEV